MSAGYLYLPMEILVREYDSRLLIALMAAEHGIEVILGQKWLMEHNMAAMPPGMWIFKTLSKRDAREMSRAKSYGNKVGSIDEEVPAFSEGSGDMLWVSRDAVDRCDAIFCLGQGHFESFMSKWPDLTSNLIITGNPRWDYLRPELRQFLRERANPIREQHGKFILINTNSGNANSNKKSIEEIYNGYVRDGKLDPSSQHFVDHWNDFMAFEKSNLAAMRPLIQRLCNEFPEHMIIVRPHPAERVDFYQNAIAGLANARVVFEGPVAPWLEACELLIHTDCTTGVEAFALGKPIICYETIESPLHGWLLSGRLSVRATSEDDVIAAAEKLLAGKPAGPLQSEMKRQYDHFIAAQDGAMAAERIARAAAEVIATIPPQDQVQGAASWAPTWRYMPAARNTRHRRLVFPKFGVSDVQTKLEHLAAALGRPVPVATAVGDNMFHICDSRLRAPRMPGTAAGRMLGRMISLLS